MTELKKQIDHYLHLLKSVLKSVEEIYYFTNVEYHKQLINGGQFAEANKNYTMEILFYLHAAALITIRRNLSWIKAIETSKKTGSYFAYCSSLRGLIEFAADAFYSIGDVPQNLAENYFIINKCIAGKESKRIHLFKELEEWGIHFIFAGKYNDPMLNKELYKAEQTWKYIQAIDAKNATQPIYHLYEKLCQITHPSKDSTHLYFIEENSLWSVNDIEEDKLIDDFEASYDKEFEIIFQKSFNASLIIIKIIDSLPMTQLKCPFINKIDFSNIPEFQKIKQKIAIQ